MVKIKFLYTLVDCFIRIMYLCIKDVPIIGSAIGNGLYRLVFSYRLSDRLVHEISSTLLKFRCYGSTLKVVYFCIGAITTL